MSVSSLPIDLRRLRNHLAIFAKRDLSMSPDECGRVALLLGIASKEADALVGQAELVPEIEDELLAVAGDLERVAAEPVSPGYQAALRAQQLQLQQALDAEGAEPVSRPGLSALATPIAGSNVTLFPVVARPRPAGGGDAA